MEVDFKNIDYTKRPVLILKNLNNDPLQPLMYAYDIVVDLKYNEVSQLSFKLPAYVNGEKTPHYDDVVGMRIIDYKDIGQFILVNPKETDNGAQHYKECTAYSLEYEMTYKNLFIEEGTYNFYNPAKLESTILGFIVEALPDWHIEMVSTDLIDKYRTFDTSNENVYNFIKNSLQDTYRCVFSFDTRTRGIIVRSVDDLVSEKPIYLSSDNLIKQIEVEEDTENIFTCLDVTGADDVNIRSVNPLGTNKLYNFDYFMNTSYFDQAMIDKYDAWKKQFDTATKTYYATSIELAVRQQQRELVRAQKKDADGKKASLETQLSVAVEANQTDEMQKLKKEIASNDAYIQGRIDSYESITDRIDDLHNALVDINKNCALERFFNDDEMKLLSRYIKESSVQDSSFVYTNVESYANVEKKFNVTNGKISFVDCVVNKVKASANQNIYYITGGQISMQSDDNNNNVDGDVISASVIHYASNQSIIVTAVLNDDNIGADHYPNGVITYSGSGSITQSEKSAFIQLNTGTLLFSQDVSEFDRRAVEWELLDYGRDTLLQCSSPTYTFDIDAGNFLSDEAFKQFKDELQLGACCYVNLDRNSNKVLTPIVTGVEYEPYDPTKLKITFGNKYSLNDSSFKLVDLLEQSISMGKQLSSNSGNYSLFVDSGASDRIKEYMDNVLDAAKQAVMAGTDQSIAINESGIRLRKSNDTGYDPEQIWMINNQIVFTNDGWDTANMAIGKLTDANGNSIYGVCAPALIGKMLVGESLTIESSKPDGKNMSFTVDGKGVTTYNATQTIANDTHLIQQSPNYGLVGGRNNVIITDGTTTGIRGNDNKILSSLADGTPDDDVSFWVDMKGNAYFNGNGKFNGVVNAKDLQIGGVSVKDLFKAGDATDEDGNIIGSEMWIGDLHILPDGTLQYQKNGQNLQTYSSTQIRYAASTSGTNAPTTGWSKNIPTVEPGQYLWTRQIDIYTDSKGEEQQAAPRYSVTRMGSDGKDAETFDYLTESKITTTTIESPTITGNDVRAISAFSIVNSATQNATQIGAMGRSYGRDITGSTTNGIAMAVAKNGNDVITTDKTNSYEYITYDTENTNYVIVTNAGVRMTVGNAAAGNNITVTSSSITMNVGGTTLMMDNTGAYYNGTELGTGSSTVPSDTVQAVWG